MGEYTWVIGVTLAAFASIISNFGLNLQKLTHLQNAHKSEERRGQYYRDRMWILGLALVIGGSVADFIALGFGNQSIIAPLGSLTLVANMFFAPLLLNESISRRDVMATIAIVVGAALCVAFASHSNDTFTARQLFSFFSSTRFAVFAVIILALMAAFLVGIRHIERVKVTAGEHSPTYRDLRPYHRFCYAALAGTIGAQSVLFAKCTAELLISTLAGDGMLFAYPQSYLVLASLGITIFLQLKWLNQGLLFFDALYIVPVFQTFWILVSVVGGLVFFGEYRSMNSLQILMFPIGVVVTICGVFVLSMRGVATGGNGSGQQQTRLGGEEYASVLGADDNGVDDLDGAGGGGSSLIIPAALGDDDAARRRFIEKQALLRGTGVSSSSSSSSSSQVVYLSAPASSELAPSKSSSSSSSTSSSSQFARSDDISPLDASQFMRMQELEGGITNGLRLGVAGGVFDNDRDHGGLGGSGLGMDMKVQFDDLDLGSLNDHGGGVGDGHGGQLSDLGRGATLSSSPSPPGSSVTSPFGSGLFSQHDGVSAGGMSNSASDSDFFSAGAMTQAHRRVSANGGSGGDGGLPRFHNGDGSATGVSSMDKYNYE